LARLTQGISDGGALLEIWLTISALSSLSIVLIAIGHSDIGMERRFRLRPVGAVNRRRKRRMTAER
jgi:lysophospholipase L1-like esterase